MNDAARQLSLSLDSVAKALAEWTVSRHEEIDGSLASRYGNGWRRRWAADVENRLHHLAQAIAVRRPAIFTESVAWTGSALALREVGTDDLLGSLKCLREVLDAELPEAAARAAVEYVDAAVDRLNGSLPRPDGQPDPARPHGQTLLKYVEAVLDGRRNDAIGVVAAAIEAGVPVRELLVHVLQAAQVAVGEMWHRGEITVADEHFATATTELAVALLRPRYPDVQRRGRRVLATAVEGDLHALGVRLVTEFFEMDGWDVLYLGANTPRADVVQALSDHGVHLLAVSATSFLHLRDVGELVDDVRRAEGLQRVKVIVGGGPFNLVPDLWSELGADGSAPTAEEAVELGNRLMSETA